MSVSFERVMEKVANFPFEIEPGQKSYIQKVCANPDVSDVRVQYVKDSGKLKVSYAYRRASWRISVDNKRVKWLERRVPLTPADPDPGPTQAEFDAAMAAYDAERADPGYAEV